jgi:hypothetical protein
MKEKYPFLKLKCSCGYTMTYVKNNAWVLELKTNEKVP